MRCTLCIVGVVGDALHSGGQLRVGGSGRWLPKTTHAFTINWEAENKLRSQIVSMRAITKCLASIYVPN